MHSVVIWLKKKQYIHYTNRVKGIDMFGEYLSICNRPFFSDIGDFRWPTCCHRDSSIRSTAQMKLSSLSPSLSLILGVKDL